MILPSFTYQINNPQHSTLVTSEELETIITGNPKQIYITDEDVFHNHRIYFSEKNTIVLTGGERNKNLDSLKLILDGLMQSKLGRNDWIIGVGGGIITDLTGFAATIYKRGIQFGFVPTTLTAMVDASIGGKNGINLGTIKNMVGTINQPNFIQIHPDFLRTLSPKYWSDGFAEIIKHALIGDKKMFSQLSTSDISFFQKNEASLSRLIFENMMFKSKLVEQDPMDQGVRNMLNLGHTLGHALEQYLSISHGIAVSIGIHFASWLSTKISTLSEIQHQEIIRTLIKYDLPVYIDFELDPVFEIMLNDKKKNGEQIRFVLLNEIGEAKLDYLNVERLKTHILTWKSHQ
jgi:3-dehydroquinate synthase